MRMSRRMGIFKRVTEEVITDTYFFNMGDLCEDLTGGWETTYDTGGYASGYGYLPADGNPTISVKTTSNNPYTQAASVGTVNAIDLTDLTTLHITVTEASSSHVVAFRVLSEKKVTSVVMEATLTGGAGEVTLDVSDLEGSYYLALVAISINAAWLVGYVSEVRGE